MIKETLKSNGARFKVEKTYEKEPAKGSQAQKKEAITVKYPESQQLNLLRKAILGDQAAKAELQTIDTFIKSL